MDPWKTRITAMKHPSAESQNACLVLIYPPGPLLGKRFELKKTKVYIGRGSDCEIQIDLDSVSRQHAQIICQQNHYHIEDKKSTNGTTINEIEIQGQERLRNGDLVQIGNSIFKFLSGGNIEANYHEAIYKMTIIDALTGAHNKRSLMDFIEREIARTQRHLRPMSLVMYDIDHFKKINDTYGHLSGDQVLREITRCVATRIRRDELLARYGGEEFVIVLPETEEKGARVFAEQIRKMVENEVVTFEGEKISVTISLGVATHRADKTDAIGLIKEADEKLYQAKKSGRNKVVS